MLIQHPGPSGSEHRPQCFLHVALGELSRERLGRPPAHPEEPGGQLVGHGTFGGFGREHRGRLFEVVGVLHSRTRSRPPPPPPSTGSSGARRGHTEEGQAAASAVRSAPGRAGDLAERAGRPPHWISATLARVPDALSPRLGTWGHALGHPGPTRGTE